MSNVNANIRIGIDSSAALAELRALQAQISTFNQSVVSGNAAAAAKQASLQKSLASMVGATGQFNTSLRTMNTGVGALGDAFDKGTLSARQYFRYAASQMPGLTRAFKSLGVEQAQMANLATDRVKRLQTQYVALGKDIRGMQKVMAITPKNLATGYATDLALAQQRQQLFNRALQMGSTGLLNWGKNTQWAGRQLMVGFTVPLTLAAGAAAKFFMELDKSAMQFRRVYGDLNTSTQETYRNLEAIKSLGIEYTKYGLAVKDVIDIGARAAATGAMNEDLMAATEQTLRLSTLGQMEYGRALDATISLQTAFAVSSEDLGKKIDFLNAVENQTVLTMEDMALAVPRVAPVIKGLGGDVEDLAVFMTALREGGVTAEQGANALKSGLASLINPTGRAQQALSELGININSIIQANRGDLMGTVKAFGEALNALDDFERQQALEQVFGKYQYARLGALFKNIANDASQSARAMDLAGTSTEELRKISEKELSIIAETVTNQFLGAIERLKVAVAPIGEMFLKAVTPVINAVSSIADAFNNLPDGVKTAIGAVVAIVGGIAPVLLMGIGLIGNAIGNGIKFILAMRSGLKGLVGALTGTGGAFRFQSGAALDAAAAMASLEGRVSGLTGDLLMQEGAVQSLAASYGRLAAAASAAAASMPRGFAMPGMARGAGRSTVSVAPGSTSTVAMARGGLVPGTGNKDTVPALLTPGESVITKEATAKYGPIISAMNSGNLPGFNNGLSPAGGDWAAKYSAFVSKRSLDSIIRKFDLAATGTGNQLVLLEKAMRNLIKQGIAPTTKLLDKEYKKLAQSSKKATRAVTTRAGGQQLELPRTAQIVSGHIGGQMAMPIERAVRMVERGGDFSKPFVDEVKRAHAAGEKFVRVYSNGVVNMTGALNEKMRQGAASLNDVRKEILDPRSQAMLRRQLQGLGLSAKEVDQRVRTFVRNLSKQLDAAAVKVGGGDKALSARQMDKVLLGAYGKAGKETFTSKPERTAFARMFQTTTWAGAGGASGRQPMFTGSERRSYARIEGLRPRSATQFAPEQMKKLGVTGAQLKAVFNEMPLAAQRAIIATAGNLDKAMPIFKEHAARLGIAFGTALTTSAATTAAPLVTKVLASSGHRSPAAAFGTAGTQDGNLYGRNYAAAVKAAIMGIGVITPPITPASGLAQQSAAAVKQAIRTGKSTAMPGFMSSGSAAALRMANAGMTPQQIQRAMRKAGTRIQGGYVPTPAPYAPPTQTAGKQMALNAQSAAMNARVAATAGAMMTANVTEAMSETRKTMVAGARTAANQSTQMFGAVGRAFTAPFKEAFQRASVSGAKNTPRGTYDPSLRAAAGRAPYGPGIPALPRNMSNELKQGITATRNALRSLPQSIRQSIPTMKESFNGLKTSVSAIGKQIKTDLGNAWKPVSTQFKTGASALGASFRNLNSVIKTGGQQFRSTLASFFGGRGGQGGSGGGMMGFFRSPGRDDQGNKMPSRFGRMMGGQGSAMGAGMALSMGSMIPFMNADEEGKFMGVNANVAGFGMMGAGALVSMIGTVPPQLLAVAGAAAAAGIAIYAWRDYVDNAARAAADFGANIGGAANALSNMAAMMGKSTPTQKLTQVQMGLTQEQSEQAFGEFQNMMGSEEGQAFIEQLEKATSADRISMLSDYVAAAIASGLMDSATGQAFAKTVAASLEDPILGNAVSRAMEEQEKGAQAMIELAEKRLLAVSEKVVKPLQQVAEESEGIQIGITPTAADLVTDKTRPTVGRLSANEASQVVGASIQVLKDFSEAAAMAQLEYEEGIITFDEYNSILQQSRRVQEEYSGYLRDAQIAAIDDGAVMQAFIDQATKAFGLTEDEVKGLEGAAAIDYDYIRELNAAGIELADNFNLNTASAMRLSDAMAALANGMSAADIQDFLTYTQENVGSRAAQFYAESAGTEGAIEKGAMISYVERNIMPGVVSEEDKEQVIDFIINFEGDVGELQAFLASIPEERVVDVIANLKVLSPEQRTKYVSDSRKIGNIVGSEVQTAVEKSISQAVSGRSRSRTKSRAPESFADLDADQTKEALELQQKYAESLEYAQSAGVFGDLESVVTFVINEEPTQGVPQRLKSITDAAVALNAAVPDEIQKMMGVDFKSNVEDIDQWSQYADQLEILSGVVMGMPEEYRELGVDLMIGENGEPKSTKAFMKDLISLEKAMNKIESGKSKLVKEGIFELITLQNGSPADADIVDQATNALRERWGVSVIENLPPNVFTKAIIAQYDASSLLAQAAALRKAATIGGEGFGAIRMKLEQEAADLQQIADTIIAGSAAGAAAAAANTGGGSAGGGSGGGGGGESKNPFKDLKKSILDQVKTFLDMSIGMDKLFSEKTKFFKLLLRDRGLDDKINALNLSPGLAAELKGMSPEDAKKVLKKITDKKGRLNTAGRQLDRAAFAGQVGQRVSEAQDRIQATRDQGVALSQLRKRNAPIGAVSAIASNAETAAEYVRLLKEANDAEKRWEDSGKKGRKAAKKEWDRAKKAVNEYVNSLVKASRLEAGRASQLAAEEQKDVVASQVQLVGFATKKGASEEVLQEIRDNADLANEFFMLQENVKQEQKEYDEIVKKFGKNSRQARKARKELEAARAAVQNFPEEIQTRIDINLQLLSPEEAIDKIYDEVEEGLTQNFNSQMLPLKEIDAQFQVAFNEIEGKYDPLIKASKDRARALQKEVEAIQDQIYELQRLNDADQFRIRALERQKEMINRQIEAIEYQNELEQRAADALSRQSELIGRQIEKLDRADELDQRRISALDRQSELLNRQIEEIDRTDELDQRRIDAISRQSELLSRQIEEVDRKNELEQRNIDKIQRADELRQRNADALNRELELMSRKEEEINEQYEKQTKALEEIETANERINNQKKQQLDLARALSEGDIYAAAQAAEQMKETQRQNAKEDRKKALEASKNASLKALRTSQGLSREQAEDMIESIGDQSYQSSLAIRDIEDQIYNRNESVVAIKDEIYKLDLEIRDIGDQIYERESSRIVILDQIREIDMQIRDINDLIYARELERIPLLDQQYEIEGQILIIQDRIYENNLRTIPLRDQIRGIDDQIRVIADLIYGRETDILKLQNEQLAPLQRSLELENRKTQNLEEQMANEKAALEINGYTYEQLQREMDVLTDQYNLQIASLDLARENAKAVLRIKKNWDAVASAIAAANKTAKELRTQAVQAAQQAMEAERRLAQEKPDYDPTEAIARIKAERDARIKQIENDRLASIDKALRDALLRQAQYRFVDDEERVARYSAAGIVKGEGSRDSVLAKLTPGEYIIRKSMVKKYGTSMFEKINAGAFSLPRYSVSNFSSEVPISGKQTNNITAPVYNTYSVNVNVPNANVNADEVANKVMQRIRSIDSGSVRNYRGF